MYSIKEKIFFRGTPIVLWHVFINLIILNLWRSFYNIFQLIKKKNH